MQQNRSPWYAETNRIKYLTVAAASVVIIAVADWFILPDVGLGFLYFFPIILASAFLSRWQIAFLSLICAALRDLYLPAAPEKWPRVVAVYVIYIFVGLFVREMIVYRRAANRHFHDLETELKRCRESEEQLQILMNSTPVGILTVSPEGNIIQSNAAAHLVFGVGPGGLSGKALASYVPELNRLSHDQGFHSSGKALEVRCRKEDGRSFPAYVWLSNFRVENGPMLMAVIASTSSDPR